MLFTCLMLYQTEAKLEVKDLRILPKGRKRLTRAIMAEISGQFCQGQKQRQLILTIKDGDFQN